jgi:hypothetical protein
MDPAVVEEAARTLIKEKFVGDFNDASMDILLRYSGMDYASTTVRVSFVGLKGELNGAAMKLALQIFQPRIAARFEKKSPPLFLEQARFLVQTWFEKSEILNQGRRDLQEGENDVPYISVPLFIKVTCGSNPDACTQEGLKENLLIDGKALASEWATLLKEKAGDVSPTLATYFNPLEYISVGLDEILPLVQVTNNVTVTPYEAPPIKPFLPWWFWAVVCVDCVLLLLACLWVSFSVARRRRRLHLELEHEKIAQEHEEFQGTVKEDGLPNDPAGPGFHAKSSHSKEEDDVPVDDISSYAGSQSSQEKPAPVPEKKEIHYDTEKPWTNIRG